MLSTILIFKRFLQNHSWLLMAFPFTSHDALVVSDDGSDVFKDLNCERMLLFQEILETSHQT